MICDCRGSDATCDTGTFIQLRAVPGTLVATDSAVLQPCDNCRVLHIRHKTHQEITHA